MANTHSTLSALFVDIANAIRAKKNSTAAIVADTFPAEIEGLKTGFDYNNQNATAISDYEFYGCTDLGNVNCYNLTNVGISAFEGCANLKTVVLYDGVENVGENAFKGCDEAIIYSKASGQPDTWDINWNPDNRPVIYGELIETWDISATSKDKVAAELWGADSNYTLFISGNGNMKNFNDANIPWYVYNKYIKCVIIHGSVTSIGDNAFTACDSLTSINIPDSVTSIGHSAFNCCTSLISIAIPNSVTSIDFNAFSGCDSLTSIIIPDGVTSIGDSTFYGCDSLTSIIIPGSVTSIGKYAFEDCDFLTSIVIPDSVTSIGYDAFSGCSNLIIHCMFSSQPDAWNINWNPDNCEVIWHGDIQEAWDISATEEDNVIAKLYKNTEKDYYLLAINGNGNMKNFISPARVPWYNYCFNIEFMVINNGITNIGDYAFYDCGFTSITIPDSVISIGKYAFFGCISLVSINIPDSVTSIGYNDFHYTNLSFNEYDGVYYLGNENNPYVLLAKAKDTSIISCNIPSNTKFIAANAFYKCNSLTSITISDSVTSISSNAFRNCTSLTSITIPDSLTYIGDNAFSYCDSLTSITYTGTLAQWNTITFDSNWNYNTSNYTIHCTDGDIAKS